MSKDIEQKVQGVLSAVDALAEIQPRHLRQNISELFMACEVLTEICIATGTVGDYYRNLNKDVAK